MADTSFLVFLFAFLSLPSSPPLHRSIHCIGNAQRKGIYYCGLQFIPRVLKTSSCPRARHGSTSLPKCDSERPLWTKLLFSPCVLLLPLLSFFLLLPSPHPLVGASVDNFAYLASRVSMPGPAFRQGVLLLPPPQATHARWMGEGGMRSFDRHVGKRAGPQMLTC